MDRKPSRRVLSYTISKEHLARCGEKMLSMIPKRIPLAFLNRCGKSCSITNVVLELCSLHFNDRRGNTNVIRQDPIPQSNYQQHLDQGLSPPTLTTDTVRFWSDYNRVFYNPRSIIQLHEYELNSALMPFEQWGTGEELFNSLDREHDLLDRDLRPFLEECDQMQAIQMISSTDDAWGGFTAKYLERIRDDLGKTSTWVFGLEEGGRRSMVLCFSPVISTPTK